MLPELVRRGIAPIGMKSLGGDGRIVKKKAARIGDALRYAMSLPVCTTISGIDSLKVLRQNLKIARGFVPMGAGERTAYEQGLRAYATDGRFELYKTTAEHEGEISAASSTVSHRRRNWRSECPFPIESPCTLITNY